LDNISGKVENQNKGYLIGGLAMILYGTKLATKDVDIVFDSQNDASLFVATMKNCGFHEVKNLTREYRDLEAHQVLESANGCRFDIFVRVVCNCLVLTAGMKKRAREVFSAGNLQLFAIAPEDIFLFKSVTNRPDDLADMALIAGHGLDWKVIEEELRNQPDFWQWLPHYYRSLEELEVEYSISSPSKRKLEKEAEIAMGIGVIVNRLEEHPLSLAEIMEILGADDSTFSLEVLERMKNSHVVKEVGGLFYLI
jgi:hypothetical protein